MNKASIHFLPALLFVGCTTLAMAQSSKDISTTRGTGGDNRTQPYDRFTPASKPRSLEDSKKSAEDGQAASQFNIGLRYRKGKGVPHDDRKAVEWYGKAAAQGHAQAQVNLGYMYEHGFGAPKDLKKAVDLYQKAAAQGFSVGQFNVGVHYANGVVLPQNDIRAYAWLYLASRNAYPDAKDHLEELGKRLTPEQKSTAKKLADELSPKRRG